MAIIEEKTKVKTFIQITYSLDGGGDDHLLQREKRRVKDESLNDFVVVSDITIDVGNKDEWKESLEEHQESIIEIRDEQVETFNEQIDLLQEQIDEINSL